MKTKKKEKKNNLEALAQQELYGIILSWRQKQRNKLHFQGNLFCPMALVNRLVLS